MILRRIVDSLHFADDRRELLRSIPEDAWPGLLKQLDPTYLTLPLAIRCRDYVPGTVQARFDTILGSHSLRHDRTVAAFHEIRECLESRRIPFITLKGLAQWPYYVDDLRYRPQFDIDLYCDPGNALAAQTAIIELGYQPLPRDAGQGTDHLPPLIRPTEWRWRNDYHDPEMPLTVEIHGTLWRPEVHGFEVHGAEAFPARRVIREIPALDPADNLSYTAWHVTRHLIGGNLRLYHVYELAHFLHRSACDTGFWREWGSRGMPAERLPEAIAFRLAMDWFGCDAAAQVSECVDRLPARVKRWFKLFSASPIHNIGDSNKDELFLHFCLARNTGDRFRIAARRIFPAKVPRFLFHADTKNERALIASRAAHHLRALVSLSKSAARWWF